MAKTEILKIRAATIVHEGTTYEFEAGPIRADTPKAVVELLRKDGALALTPEERTSVHTFGTLAEQVGGSHATTVANVGDDPGAEDPDAHLQPGAGDAGGGTPVPDDAPDIANASTEDIARYLAEQRTNGPTTVALAEGDPTLAARVLEAENLAMGGDGRRTVVVPLQKIIDSGGEGE